MSVFGRNLLLLPIKIYLWKQGSLFCFVLFCAYQIHPTGMLQIVFLVFLESSWGGRGASAWFHDGIWTCEAKVLEYWMISSLEIELNRSWKFRKNWDVPLMLLERSWWAGFNEIYLVRFGFRMWEILIFKWFLSDFLGPVPETIPLDPTFGSFTLLKPVSHWVNRFLGWKCLDCLDWNGLFWCSH
jgi:hypothetical protein